MKLNVIEPYKETRYQYLKNYSEIPYTMIARAVLYGISENLYKEINDEYSKPIGMFYTLKDYTDYQRSLNDKVYALVMQNEEVQAFLNGKELEIDLDRASNPSMGNYYFNGMSQLEFHRGLKYINNLPDGKAKIVLAPPKFPKDDPHYNLSILDIYKTLSKYTGCELGYSSSNGMNPAFIKPFDNTFYSYPSNYDSRPPFSFYDALNSTHQVNSAYEPDVFDASTFLAWMLYNPDKWTTTAGIDGRQDAYIHPELPLEQPHCKICQVVYILDPFKTNMSFEDGYKFIIIYGGMMTTSYRCKSALLPMSDTGLYRIADLVARRCMNRGGMTSNSDVNVKFYYYTFHKKRFIRKTEKLETYEWLKDIRIAALNALKAVSELENLIGVYNEKGIREFYSAVLDNADTKINTAKDAYGISEVVATGIVGKAVYNVEVNGETKHITTSNVTIE